MRIFGVGEQEIEATDQRGRLTHPVRTALFGFLFSIGAFVIEFSRQVNTNNSVIGFLIFLSIAPILSCMYAFVGWRYSRRIARAVVGAIALAIGAVGTGYLLWLGGSIRFLE